MQVKISEELYTVLQYAREESMRTGCLAISADHILLGILRHGDNMACFVLRDLGIDLQDLKKSVEKLLFREQSIPYAAADKLTVARSAQNAINMSAFESIKAGAEEVLPIHMLLALMKAGGLACAEFLSSSGVTPSRILERIGDKNGGPAAGNADAPGKVTDEVRKSVESQIRSIVLLSPRKKTTIVS